MNMARQSFTKIIATRKTETKRVNNGKMSDAARKTSQDRRGTAKKMFFVSFSLRFRVKCPFNRSLQQANRPLLQEFWICIQVELSFLPPEHCLRFVGFFSENFAACPPPVQTSSQPFGHVQTGRLSCKLIRAVAMPILQDGQPTTIRTFTAGC